MDSLVIGTVVGNADYTDTDHGQYLGRVKVHIAGLTGTGKEVNIVKAIGSNAGGDMDHDAIRQTEQFEVWAYVMAPMMGESSMGKYNRTHNSSGIGDGNDMSNFTHPDTYTTATASQFHGQQMDGHAGGPNLNMSSGTNPYGNAAACENYSDSGKGVFSMPAANSKVIIGFINGGRGRPVVLGKIHSGTEIEQIHGAGNAYPDYPGPFENTKAASATVPT
jgi:hypothetical protein